MFSSAEIEIKNTVTPPTSCRTSGPMIYETTKYPGFRVYARHPSMIIDQQSQCFEKRIKDMFGLCHSSSKENT